MAKKPRKVFTVTKITSERLTSDAPTELLSVEYSQSITAPTELPPGSQYVNVNPDYDENDPNSRLFIHGPEVPPIKLGRITTEEIDCRVVFAVNVLKQKGREEPSRDEIAAIAEISTGSVSKSLRRLEAERKVDRQPRRIRNVRGISSTDLAVIVPDSSGPIQSAENIEEIVKAINELSPETRAAIVAKCAVSDYS